MAKTKKNVQKKRRQLRKKTRGGKIKGGTKSSAYAAAEDFAGRHGYNENVNVIYYQPGSYGGWDIIQMPCKMYYEKMPPRILQQKLQQLFSECYAHGRYNFVVYSWYMDVPTLTMHVRMSTLIPRQQTRDEQISEFMLIKPEALAAAKAADNLYTRAPK